MKQYLTKWPLSTWLIGFFFLNVVLFLIFLLTKTFYPFLVILNIASLITLWIVACYQEKFSWKIHRLDVYLAVGLFLLALVIRLWQIDGLPPGMFNDEVTVAKHGMYYQTLNEMPPYGGEPYVSDHHYHPTPLEYLIAWSIGMFGKTITSIRLPVAVIGALNVVVFYVLLRQFFSRKFATIGGLFLVASYSHLVLSRLAYEPVPSMFFQLFAVLFAWLYHKTGKLQYLIGIGLALGGGIYTYLNFRLFAVLLVILTIVLIMKKAAKSDRVAQVIWFFMAMFIAVAPLASYAILQPVDFFAGRAQELSIFAYPLAPGELPKELIGNVYRILGVLVGGGDPNPGKNPANQGIFDLVTLVVFYGGLAVLFFKKRMLFFIALLLLVPPILSDSFSLERNPSFHYYGLGHPNLLRVSGAIIIVYFLAVWGLQFLHTYLERYNKTLAMVIVGSIAGLIIFLNLNFYFNQQSIYPLWYRYNYIVNKTPTLHVLQAINQSPEPVLYVSPSFLDSGHAAFFSTKKLIPYTPASTSAILQDIQTHPVTVLEFTNQNQGTVVDIANRVNSGELPLQMQVGYTPFGSVEAFIFRPL